MAIELRHTIEVLFDGVGGGAVVAATTEFVKHWLEIRSQRTQPGAADDKHRPRRLRLAALFFAIALGSGAAGYFIANHAMAPTSKATSETVGTPVQQAAPQRLEDGAPHAITKPTETPRQHPATGRPNLTRPGKSERTNRSATVADGVYALLREDLQVEQSKIKPQSDLILDLGATPLDVKEIVMNLEMSYGITVSDSEARKLKNVQDLVDFVESKTQIIPAAPKPPTN